MSKTSTAPEQMIAIVVERLADGRTALREKMLPTPKPKAGEILIRVMAAGVNRADLVQRFGTYPVPEDASPLLGLEVSGVVVRGGGRWREGDKVCALMHGGGYAQYAICDHRHALPIPSELDFAAAAAIPETACTVYANVFEQGKLSAGETFMVHGATSGIGTTAIQMAKAAGATVIATARGADKAALALAIGADIVIDTTREDFAEIAMEAGGCDVILDMVGGPFFNLNLKALRFEGRLVQVAGLAGMAVELDLMAMMTKRAVITGSALRPRTRDEKARIVAGVESMVWPWLETGQFSPHISAIFAHSDSENAHALMESGNFLGKIALTFPFNDPERTDLSVQA